MKNKTIYNKNMRLFEKRYPTMYNKVKSAEEPHNLLVEEARNGQPTLSYLQEGKKISIHSKYDPEMEAFRWAEGLGQDWDVLVLFGAGLGYHLLALTNLYPGKKVILVERDYSFLQFPMHYMDLSRVLKNNLDLVISSDPKRAGNTAGTYLVKNISKNILFKTLTAYEKILDEYWNTFRQVITDHAKRYKTDFFTRQRWQAQWFLNFRENFLTYMENPGINSLFNKFKNVPVVIVSAGPSLEKNIDLLHEMKNRAVIIGAGSAIFPLLKRNIIPDLYLSFEPGKNNYNYIFSKLERNDFPLVCGSTIYPQVIREYKGPMLSFTVDVFGDWFEKQAKLEKGTLSSGGTISIVSFDLAQKLGGNPIIFIGQDLAYTNMKHYADSIEHAKDITETERKLFQVDGIDGPVYTDNPFWSMKLQFDDLVRKALMSGHTVIDATEGGVIINGTKIHTLREVIDKYCNKEVPVKDIIEKPLREKEPLAHEHIITIKKSLEMLQQNQILFDKCFSRVVDISKKMIAHIEINDINRKKTVYDQSLKEIKKCMRQVEKTNIYTDFVYIMNVHQLHVLKRDILKKIADAKTIEEKLERTATGYAMLFQKIQESLIFLEKKFFKTIEEQVDNRFNFSQ